MRLFFGPENRSMTKQQIRVLLRFNDRMRGGGDGRDAAYRIRTDSVTVESEIRPPRSKSRDPIPRRLPQALC
jgi:hypothetical protein